MKSTRKKSISSRRSFGFSLPELIVSVSIIGTLSAIAIPSYVGQLCRSESSEAESTIGTIQAVISAYIDETGAFPKTWDDISSITAIMTNSGIATGALSNPITLPNQNYKLTVNGPTNSLYEMIAERTKGCEKRNIRACLDVSSGASDQKRGDGNADAKTPICS